MRRRLLLLIPIAIAISAAAHDEYAARARAAVESGEIKPLAELLTAVHAHYDGRVIETELVRRHDRWTYEFKLLPATGRLYRVQVDAANGEVVGTRGPVQERH